jgi:hypothetical protein
MAAQLPLGNGIEQRIRSPHEVATLIDRLAAYARRVGSQEDPLTMLACDPLAKILDSDLKSSPTSRTFLDKVGGVLHFWLTPFFPASPSLRTELIVAGNACPCQPAQAAFWKDSAHC